ncbi:hypothetical protein BJ322DRAFT_492827 [Thelephora terrestris]|uniref:Uncharacterized protein n=1 Tax=Thelephora terrestris TaxID=56493 RepID=A0A9P6H4G4_9AGAM|nr:hypothetical protein BJ322DRAFT_492827 [Thelephora terrestris]
MEDFRQRDNYWSPPLTADSTVPFSQADPLLLTPNRGIFDNGETAPHSRYTDKSQFSSPQALHSKLAGLGSGPRRLFRGFERPSFVRIAILAVLSLSAYPAFYILTLVARDKSLFVVRLIVAMWCSGVGFALEYIIVRIGVQHLEAATWATVIHLGHEGGGMKLGDLARNSQNPTSFISALLICISRFGSRETARDSRGSYDKRPWPLFIMVFAVLAILGPTLPFLFGRIMIIETFTQNQRAEYREVLIAGDLSPDDVNRATDQLGAFQSFAQTWTLLPYGRTPPDTVEFAQNNDTVYFAQPTLSQLVPGGSGSGTFNVNQTASLDLGNNPNDTLALLMNGNAPRESMGELLRYSQWGIRIHCQKLPNPTVNLIPQSNQSFTYAFLPQDFLQGLFASYGMNLPTSLTKPDLTLLDPNDTIPATIDPLKISYLIKWYSNGVAHSFHTRTILDTVNAGQGWTTVETVLIRLNTSYTPSGRFPVYSNESVPDAHGMGTRIGYDAAVCVERYDPWIVEAYNTSVGFPATLRIVENGYGNTSLPSGKIRGYPIQNTRYLNTTNKNPAFYVAHDNSINQMVKDNGRDFPYVPSPTAVSFTDGAGPEGYIELSPDRFAVIRARVDAANVLPFLAGSGHIVAQSYPDQTRAYVRYVQWQLIGLPILVLLLGIIGELFVPTLPLDIPRRGFGVYSWLALFQSQELRFEVARDLHKLMTLEELEKKFSDKEVRFAV